MEKKESLSDIIKRLRKVTEEKQKESKGKEKDETKQAE